MDQDIATCCGQDESSLQRLSRYTLHGLCEKGDAESFETVLKTAETDEDYDPSVGSLAQTIDINAKDNTGCTPLHTALLYAQINCVKVCLSHKAKLGIRCNGSPLYHILLSMGSVPHHTVFLYETVALFIENSVDTTLTDDAQRNIFHILAYCIAAFHTTDESSDLTVSKGVTIADRLYRTVQSSPIALSIPDFIQTFINNQDRTGATPLHTAAEYQNEPYVRWLLEHGANPTITDKVGDTPAHIAAKMGWKNGMTFLLDQYIHTPSSSVASTVTMIHATNTSTPHRLVPRNAIGLTPMEYLAPVTTTLTSSSSSSSSSLTSPNTLVLTHEICAHHHTCPPITRDVSYFPPENNLRLDVLLNPTYGTLLTEDLRQKIRIVYGAPPAKMADVLRVHEYEYIRRIIGKVGESNPASYATDGSGIKLVDSDTTLSRQSWTAALHAAGAVCAAIDNVLYSNHRTAFCPVRPPGHHAGPRGIVTCERDPEGSHGFCLLNNVAVGASYAIHHYGRNPGNYGTEIEDNFHNTSGKQATALSSSLSLSSSLTNRPVIRKVAIFDFDVHHGNGTEAILRNLVPHECIETVTLPFARAAVSMMSYRPWLDHDDGNRVMFISSHGYGSRRDEDNKPVPNSLFYPGSGTSTGWDVNAIDRITNEANGNIGSTASTGIRLDSIASPRVHTYSSETPVAMHAPSHPVTQHTTGQLGGISSSAHSTVNNSTNNLVFTIPTPTNATVNSLPPPLATLASPRTVNASLHAHHLNDISSRAQPEPVPNPSLIPKDTPLPEPLLEQKVVQPHIINIAMNHGYGPRTWRRIMAADVLPRLADFQPDLILVSAGFDAHKADTINSGYMRLTEDDYYWITRQLVKIANTTANGRVVSVLEGGYKVQGRVVSPFARSVAAHVRALSGGFTDTWDTEREKELLIKEIQWETEQAALKAANEANNAATMSATPGALNGRTPKPNRSIVSTTNAASTSKTALLLGSTYTGSNGTAAADTTTVVTTASSSVAHPDTVNLSSSSSSSHTELSSPVHHPSSLSQGDGDNADGLESTNGRRSKRRRAAVDYAVLDAQLAAEEAGKTSRTTTMTTTVEDSNQMNIS